MFFDRQYPILLHIKNIALLINNTIKHFEYRSTANIQYCYTLQILSYVNCQQY